MQPAYFIENRYSFVVDALRDVSHAAYEVDTPETAFERDVQAKLAAAHRLLMDGKYSAALSEYRHLRGLIAKALSPKISVFDGTRINWTKLAIADVSEALLVRSTQMLNRTPFAFNAVPPTFQGTTPLSPALARALAPFEELGVKDRETNVGVLLEDAEASISRGDFAAAGKSIESALGATRDKSLAAALTHDLAIIQERTGNRDQAVGTMRKAASLFDGTGNRAAQVSATEALADIHQRGGNTQAAAEARKQADDLRIRHGVFAIETGAPKRPVIGTGTLLATRPLAETAPIRLREDGHANGVAENGTVHALAEATDGRTARFMSFAAFADRQTVKELKVAGTGGAIQTVPIGQSGSSSLKAFYETLRKTSDLTLLMGYLNHHTLTVAYLTHLQGWVIPMAIGDCLAALGSYDDAEAEYLSTLNYPYLNQVVETVTLWLRLAELYVDRGDKLYRAAGNDPTRYGPAKAEYEKVMRLNNTLDLTSPLYASPKFAAMRTRAQAVIQARFVDNTPLVENPRITMVLSRARLQLSKIAGNLNFLGLGVHLPPFSFEHMQNLARYFAQHAAQVEQMYIQFKSTGENEALREQQMQQQVALAAASVELERRGVAEAQEGVDVANANLNAATVQRDNAIQVRDDFAAVRWELQELERLQAWAGSASNDEVKLNVKNATYYSADSKPRSHVLFDLANRRARISHDLEATRLQNEVEQANAYRAVAQQQVQQAAARVAVAQQRVAIAELQEQNARDNLEFLQEREFTSALWYGMARESRRISERYLDMAVEVAILMEKAYEAETGRNLRKIKLEYGKDELNGLLGADALLLDIDYFSLDFVRTKSKRAQMKQTLSIGDLFPMAFEQLLRTGRTYFETTLEHFDRRYPGFYLQKVKQVELLFIGLGGTEGVHGTLRNVGLSKFRQKDGTIVQQVYPADVMPLSDYDIRQDALVFQLDSKELRLFENNGIATMWRLDVPLSSNTFDLRQILDVQLVLYYDGYFSDSLEAQILASLPTSGTGSRALGLRLYAPDELFFLRSQGSANLEITPQLFAANETQHILTSYTIQAVGTNVAGMKLAVQLDGAGASHTFTLDADGSATSAGFPAPLNRTLYDTWTFTINAADNPQLVTNGKLDLSGLVDLSLFVEYSFDYRQ